MVLYFFKRCTKSTNGKSLQVEFFNFFVCTVHRRREHWGVHGSIVFFFIVDNSFTFVEKRWVFPTNAANIANHELLLTFNGGIHHRIWIKSHSKEKKNKSIGDNVAEDQKL